MLQVFDPCGARNDSLLGRPCEEYKAYKATCLPVATYCSIRGKKILLIVFVANLQLPCKIPYYYYYAHKAVQFHILKYLPFVLLLTGNHSGSHRLRRLSHSAHSKQKTYANCRRE